ncbi:MAG: zinc dependent phospholipase C family protein [Desulfarculaceae bacterium]|nr:zinc dependent phospholipase C family protein [Desulfarculaceae bacterium]MCF8071776.1 zinc dependent phospholipase C family protein [Desulfarculaceae bacterium]MCF8101326.1 zinc dependent phospholipase C family protein [Desulfarculaceae bacterium]MCF8117285.1 zinc dependent phospholipase C family protein [Desulfarculaceae bacterium]
MSWIAPSLRVLLLALLLGGLALPAWALGPFSHFTFGRKLWPSLGAQISQDAAARQELWPHFLAGSIALDAGYYPGAESSLSYAIHLIKPWELTRALLDLARTPQEKAFALGWLSHALLDLRAHRDLVNVFTKGPFSQHKLEHKRFEWGLDAWLLAQPQGAWLWDAPLAWEADLELWQRALTRVHGRQVPKEVLATAMQAHRKEVVRLPYVFWLSGQIGRQGRWAGNALGWLLGHSARPLYVWWLGWRNKDMDVRAVLSAHQPRPGDLDGLWQVMGLSGRDIDRVLAGGPWPTGSLDADESCASGQCPDALKARAWLDSLPKATP